MSKKTNALLGGVFGLATIIVAAFGAKSGAPSQVPCGSECYYAYPVECENPDERYRYCDYFCEPNNCISGWDCVSSC